MNPWNPESLSKRFETTALSAERYMEECKWKVSRTDSYKALHDEHLAKFYVYNYIHGRTFLDSPKSFLAEMNSFLMYTETSPGEAFDAECFLEWRKRYIMGLIAEVKKAWPQLV